METDIFFYRVDQNRLFVLKHLICGLNSTLRVLKVDLDPKDPARVIGLRRSWDQMDFVKFLLI